VRAFIINDRNLSFIAGRPCTISLWHHHTPGRRPLECIDHRSVAVVE